MTTITPGADSSRLQIDNSILASLIALSQSLGQLQGEIAVLKASGVNIDHIQRDIESLNKIVISGDGNIESVTSQIRRLKEAVESIKDRLKDVEETLDGFKDEAQTTKLETKKINLENWWQVIIIIITAVSAGAASWLGLS